MISFPNAKINIGLRVLAKREDGFHELETIFYPIRLNDALEIIEAPAMKFSTSGIGIPGENEANLCLKAYDLLSLDFALPSVQIHLHKHIPIGAGLGGGSADATFMISLLNEKFRLGLTTDERRAYAESLGSDCAFFVDNVPALARGRGEVLSAIELDLSIFNIVLIMPPVHVSTADAFKGIIPASEGQCLNVLIENPVPTWKDIVVNDFEKSVFSKYPEIEAIKFALYEAGAVYASMSGSGAYGLFETAVQLPDLEVKNEVYYRV